MLLNIIFLQLLLFYVQSSKAKLGRREIFITNVRPVINVWITELMNNNKEQPPAVAFHDEHQVAGVNDELAKNIELYRDISIERQIIKAKHKISPYFGMLPLFMSVKDMENRYEMVGYRNFVSIPDDGKFKLACVTHGVHDFHTVWINGEGRQMSSEKKLSNDGTSTYLTEIMKVDAGSYMKSYGCMFSSSYFEAPIIKWFNFTALERTDVKLSADLSTCGQVTFTCLEGDSIPQIVGWVLNGEPKRYTLHQMTVRLNETKLKKVECVVRNRDTSTSARLEFDQSEISVCPGAGTKKAGGKKGGTKKDGTKKAGGKKSWCETCGKKAGTEKVSTEKVSTERVSTERVSTEKVSTEKVSTEKVDTERDDFLTEENVSSEDRGANISQENEIGVFDSLSVAESSPSQNVTFTIGFVTGGLVAALFVLTIAYFTRKRTLKEKKAASNFIYGPTTRIEEDDI